jgi:nitroreductase
MNGDALTREDLIPLFDAARWAPSSRNSQEWRFFYALKGDRHFDTIFHLLSENNQRWCSKAGALIVLVSKKTTRDGRHIRSHSLDSGMAFQNAAIEATRRDLVIHPMGAFDRSKMEAFLNLGEDYAVEIMIAVGRPGPSDALEEDRPVTLRNEVESFMFHLDEIR